MTMNGYPRDMFEEMDEIFDHLFARMQEDFRYGNPQFSGFRVLAGRPDEDRFLQEVPSRHPRAAVNPAAEIHRLGDEVKVIAELPGATPEQIRLEIRDSVLVIEAEGVETPYHTTAELPAVDEGSMQSTFRNGVLEVTFRIRS
jgi:HSP20 family molecular chaperone IbpA